MINFFDAVTYKETGKSFGESLLEKVDHYFYLGGRNVAVIREQQIGNCEGVVLCKPTPPSLLETALKITSYCTIVIPTLLLITKIILRSIYKFHFIPNRNSPPYSPPQVSNHNSETLKISASNQDPAEQEIKRFWEKHVCSFKISHGTTVLYRAHFKKHGISATYPAALEQMIQKIRTVWKNHEHDIMKRTNYFKLFEGRYDQARNKQEIATSFSAQQSITVEYTTGARRGGEWIREIGYFLREAANKSNVLSPDEQETLLQAQALVDVMNTLPPMIVKINAGCPDLYNGPFSPFGYKSLLVTLEAFSKRVKEQCTNWKDPQQLSQYMQHVLLPELEKDKKRISTIYELVLYRPVAAKHLEFELVKEARAKEDAPPTDYPKLDFDKPTTLSREQIGKLQITPSGLSDLKAYQDSRFEYQEVSKDLWTVIRKKRTEMDDKVFALEKAKEKMRKHWIHVFGCKKFLQTT